MPVVLLPAQISTSLKPLFPDASSALRFTQLIRCGDDSVTSMQRGPPLIMSKRLLQPLLSEMISALICLLSGEFCGRSQTMMRFTVAVSAKVSRKLKRCPSPFVQNVERLPSNALPEPMPSGSRRALRARFPVGP